jgi:hypothetical protein
MGKIVVSENSISFIPQKFLRRLRMLWIQVMQRALDNDEELDWKKYFLLPVILFDSVAAPDAKVLKQALARRIELLENDQWDSFTVGSLSIPTGRKAHSQLSVEDHEVLLHTLAKKYAKAGELSKALKVLQRTNSDAPSPDETIEKLRSKFPAPIADYSDELDALNNFQISDDTQRIEVSQEKVSSIVFGLKRMVKHGFDRMRHEHLKALFGSERPCRSRVQGSLHQSDQ